MKKTGLKAAKLLLPLAAVILTALPGSFVMRFFAGEGKYYYESVSGFDLLLIGYGNYGPMLTGVLSALMVLKELLRLKKVGTGSGIGQAASAFVCSLLYNLLSQPTVCSVLISVILLVNGVLCYIEQKRVSLDTNS